MTCTDAEWDFAFALNVRSMWRAIRAALPGMLERGGGSIVNMASACSSVKGAPNRFVYGTTKAAVIGLTKSVATEYVALGIRCNTLCPVTATSTSRSEEHTSELQSRQYLVCRLLLEKKNPLPAQSDIA